jgi:hypothetical protein
MGVGTAAGPFSLGTAAQNAVDYELTSSSTTGPVRGIYVSLTQTAAANTGSAIKGILTVANVATGVSNGVHAELSITGASGSITSTAAPLKSTVTVAAASTTPGGTLGVATLESNIDTAVTVPTTWYFIRCINSGAKPIGYFAEIPTASNGTLFAAHVTDAMSHSIRIKSAAGTTYYIMCTATATNRS